MYINNIFMIACYYFHNQYLVFSVFTLSIINKITVKWRVFFLSTVVKKAVIPVNTRSHELRTSEHHSIWT